MKLILLVTFCCISLVSISQPENYRLSDYVFKGNVKTVVNQTTSKCDDKDGCDTITSTYNFSSDGLLINSYVDYPNGYSISNRYSYNQYGWPIERILEEHGEYYTRSTYEYNDSGKVIKQTDFDRAGKLQLAFEFEYDSLSRQIFMMVIEPSGNLKESAESVYNLSGNLEYKSRYFGDDYEESIYSYDKDNRLVTLEFYTTDETFHPYRMNRTETYHYDENGELKKTVVKEKNATRVYYEEKDTITGVTTTKNESEFFEIKDSYGTSTSQNGCLEKDSVGNCILFEKYFEYRLVSSTKGTFTYY